jgi:antitoxin ChpS
METSIRKIGNSTGAIIPISILRKLKLSEGDTLTISEEKGKIVMSTSKPKYTLKELLAKCDFTIPAPVNEWDSVEPVGNEKW